MLVANCKLTRVSEDHLKLGELARAAGTSARTVRYYVQRGLLPPPFFRGKDSTYGQAHLTRLRAIRRLQDAFFPLEAIAGELARHTEEEITLFAEGKDLPAPPSLTEIGVAPSQADLDVPPSEPPPAYFTVPGPARTLRRIEIAPGLELNVDDDAPAESQQLALRILRILGSAS